MGSQMRIDHGHPAVRAARAVAFTRSGNVCQFCGQRDAVEAHHWPADYPANEDHTADHFTALCRPCHRIATAVRRYKGSIWTLVKAIEREAE